MSRCGREHGSIASFGHAGHDRRASARVLLRHTSLKAVHVAAGLRLLSDEERKQHDRLAFARDRRDYAAAHALPRIALAAHTKTPAEQLL